MHNMNSKRCFHIRGTSANLYIYIYIYIYIVFNINKLHTKFCHLILRFLMYYAMHVNYSYNSFLCGGKYLT